MFHKPFLFSFFIFFIKQFTLTMDPIIIVLLKLT